MEQSRSVGEDKTVQGKKSDMIVVTTAQSKQPLIDHLI